MTTGTTGTTPAALGWCGNTVVGHALHERVVVTAGLGR